MGRAGLDWIVVDLEHGYATETALMAHLTAIEVSGAVALVRPPSGERLRVGRALDLGAAGIVIPRLDTVEQVREAVTFLRYPGGGQRGVALLTRGARLGTVNHAGVAALNQDIVGIVQIESPSAAEAADEIAAIDGVDVLFVGPADLSHSLGVAGRFADPSYQAAIRGVVDACRAHGKAAGILLYDHASFRPHLDMGFSFVGLGADISFGNEGVKAALAAARGG
jgi:2-dehydro-3-deoxyglucarate aldolase/4-hydroxy-2-oxoheptanedioate aldolase